MSTIQVVALDNYFRAEEHTRHSFFRIFNPVTQAKRFDPDGAYIARWVPEALTPSYPGPLVDLAESRRQALDAYESIR